jgi:Fe-S cluster biogenesis protein NfuA
MNAQSPVYVSLEFTPNPNTLKYSVNRPLYEDGAVTFRGLKDAEGKSPLAERLLAIHGIQAITFGKDFVTITKGEDGDWDAVHRGASEGIEAHLTQGLPVFNEGFKAKDTAADSGVNAEVIQKIKAVLENEIRPAVAGDGGDISFDRFEDGVVYVYLQGSCAGCPSSTMTLKMGIERRLQEVVPEVREVVSV